MRPLERKDSDVEHDLTSAWRVQEPRSHASDVAEHEVRTRQLREQSFDDFVQRIRKTGTVINLVIPETVDEID